MSDAAADQSHPGHAVTAQELLILTGMSGAGLSTAGNALEDAGWYVVDNLPPQMLRPLVDLAEHAGTSLPRVAAIVDVRGGRLFADARDAIEQLRAQTELRMLFLDATDAALVRRFEQVRRPHPLQEDGTLLDGISAERERMSELRAMSDQVIDTTDYNIHQLASLISERFGETDGARLRVTLMSFGFKYGTPTDADNMMDARFLPNPYWEPDLRPYTGLDERVRAYVLGSPGAREFVDGFSSALAPVLSGYQREHKRHATIAIGCTGGMHRSVAIAEELAGRLGQLPGVAVSVRHRDLGRE